MFRILGENFLAPTYKLENDPMCGITTGGDRQCFWDCEFWSDPYFGALISNPECLEDCYPEVIFLIIKIVILLPYNIIKLTVLGQLSLQSHSRLQSCWWYL